MKVLFLCNLVPAKLGAFESFVTELGRELTGGGNEMTAVFAQDPSPAVANRFQSAGVIWHSIKVWEGRGGQVRPWRVVLPAIAILKKERPDVVAVHFGNELPTLLLILLSKVLIRKTIRWVWHQRQQIRDPSLGLEGKIGRIKLLSLACDHFVALYKAGRESLLLRTIPREKISVIYNGVPEYPGTSERARLRSDLGVSTDDFTITNVSSLISRKRLDVTLRAFAMAKGKVSQEAPEDAAKTRLRLVLVGEGPGREKLAKMIEELGLGSDVVFAGQRNDVRDVLNASDLMVLTSDAEACPMVVLEAMSVGLPCVLTEAGAAKELVGNGVTGYVVERGDHMELAERISELARDDLMRTSMGDAARKRVSNKFTLRQMVFNHIDLYTALANR